MRKYVCIVDKDHDFIAYDEISLSNADARIHIL